MIKDRKRLIIGYFNQVLFRDWAFPSWLGAVKAARRLNVNLVSFYGQPMRANRMEGQSLFLYLKIRIKPLY